MRILAPGVLVFFVVGTVCAQKAIDPYQKIALTLSKEASKLSSARIAVMPFRWVAGSDDAGAKLVSERLTTRIVKIGQVQVVERVLLNKVLTELKLGASGVINADSAKQLGKVLEVSGIVTGTLADVGNAIEINARLIETETGRVLIAESLNVKSDWLGKQSQSKGEALEGQEETSEDKQSSQGLLKSSEGYLNTKWGMSQAQVKKLYPKVQAVDKDHLALEGEVGGKAATTFFYFTTR